MFEKIPSVNDVLLFWKSLPIKNANWDTFFPYPWSDEEMNMLRLVYELMSGNSDSLAFLTNSGIGQNFIIPVPKEYMLAYSPINFMTHFAMSTHCKLTEAELNVARQELGVRDVLQLPITEYSRYRSFYTVRDECSYHLTGRIPASVTIPYVKIPKIDDCEDWLRKEAILSRNRYARDFFKTYPDLTMTKASLPSFMIEKLETVRNAYHWIAINSAMRIEKQLFSKGIVKSPFEVEHRQPSFNF